MMLLLLGRKRESQSVAGTVVHCRPCYYQSLCSGRIFLWRMYYTNQSVSALTLATITINFFWLQVKPKLLSIHCSNIYPGAVFIILRCQISGTRCAAQSTKSNHFPVPFPSPIRKDAYMEIPNIIAPPNMTLAEGISVIIIAATTILYIGCRQRIRLAVVALILRKLATSSA